MAKATVDTTPAEKRLKALFKLQLIDSQIDKIKIVRGELPMEVEDLEDEIAGLATRANKIANEIEACEDVISKRKNTSTDALELIKKYEDQQKNVRNNREYDALSKEIEFQSLEIQLSDKKITEAKEKLEQLQKTREESQAKLDAKKVDLEGKKKELEAIVEETQKEEERLTEESKKASGQVEERLLTAYQRIRTNVRNGLAIVSVERDACGGCYNKIPPQRQLDIRMRKKILVCEHCGRILVDPDLAETVSLKVK